MDYFSNLWQEIMARPDGPMSFRLYLQPTMATIYAIIGGIADARGGKPPYFWSLFTDPLHRAALMKDGWKSVRNVFFLAIGMDIVYELIVLRGFRPVQAVIVAAGQKPRIVRVDVARSKRPSNRATSRSPQRTGSA